MDSQTSTTEFLVNSIKFVVQSVSEIHILVKQIAKYLDTNDNFEYDPISTKEDFNCFENKLKNKEYLLEFVSCYLLL